MENNGNRKTGSVRLLRSIVLVLLTASIVTAIVLFANYRDKMRDAKPFQISLKDVQTMKYEELQGFLKEQGFTNLDAIAMEDLTVVQEDMSEMVDQVKIDQVYIGSDTFDVYKKYPLDSKIEIEYHSMQKFSPPVSSENIMENGYNYNELKKMFEEAGFTNIILNPCPALITAGENDIGRVITVSIGSEEEFELDSRYEMNQKVIISYLTFKNAPSAED